MMNQLATEDHVAYNDYIARMREVEYPMLKGDNLRNGQQRT